MHCESEADRLRRRSRVPLIQRESGVFATQESTQRLLATMTPSCESGLTL